MKIVTKFNVGDKVYTLDKESMKLKEFEVAHVIVVAAKDNVRISYSVKCDGYHSESYDEQVCFASKDELLTYITAVDVVRRTTAETWQYGRTEVRLL